MQIPPEVVRYLKGPIPESRQFDFLIGDWEVAATRYQADGKVLMSYRARWSAQQLNDGRMVMDDFKALSPGGETVSSYVTLRTYCEVTGRWEMAGLSALQPAFVAEWYGNWANGEMLLQATGKNPQGSLVRTRIRFFAIESNRFAWESLQNTDDGAPWTLVASLIAIRV